MVFGRYSLLLWVLLFLPSCNRTAAPLPAQPHQVYHVRGQIVQLPQISGPDHSIYIHNEAIPEFVDQNGNKSGMMPMTMPFELAKTLSVSGLAARDKIAFTLDVDWPNSQIQITQISKIPDDTKLMFGKMGIAPATQKQ